MPWDMFLSLDAFITLLQQGVMVSTEQEIWEDELMWTSIYWCLALYFKNLTEKVAYLQNLESIKVKIGMVPILLSVVHTL